MSFVFPLKHNNSQFSSLVWVSWVLYNITTDVQSASLSRNKAPVWGLRPGIYYCQTVAGLLMWGAISDERTGLSFTIAPGPCQRIHFRVRVLWILDHILLSQIRDFPFRRLLQLTGLRWRYSTPPPHGSQNSLSFVFMYLYLLLAWVAFIILKECVLLLCQYYEYIYVSFFLSNTTIHLPFNCCVSHE
jgi:hypothetical protein